VSVDAAFAEDAAVPPTGSVTGGPRSPITRTELPSSENARPPESATGAWVTVDVQDFGVHTTTLPSSSCAATRPLRALAAT
jgi:hypothetical protein